MEMILEFLVDNYIWVLIISVFLILVLIGYIADQKRKLNNIRKEKEQVSTNNVNIPVQEEVQNNEIVQNPVISEPINVSDNVVETPSFEPIAGDTIPVVEEVSTNNVIEPPIETQTNVLETPVIDIPVEEPETDLISEPIFEESPQTILDIPDNVTDIESTVQDNNISIPTPIEINTPIIEEPEIIDELEIIDEPVNAENIVNSWEPVLAQENKDIINDEEIKDSI
ncbi:MAG: hypothetical protein E7166_02100 [Firmicutes bacterium]|nr:hypothetical protein [Bacillota bacterium]